MTVVESNPRGLVSPPQGRLRAGADLPHAPQVAMVELRRFSVQEYHRLIDDGFFADDENFELLDGYLVRKMTRGPFHDAVLMEVREILARVLPREWQIRVQCAVTTADSEPEPDLAVVRGRSPRDYISRHPGPADTALVVEVSYSSIVRDRGLKSEIYARAGFPSYWLINLVDRRVEVLTDPSGPDSLPAYRRRVDFGPGQTIITTIGGVEIQIPVDQLLLSESSADLSNPQS